MKIILYIFFAINFLSAQTVVGVIRDSISGEPLPYANIASMTKNIGVTTDEKGYFEIDVNNYLNDTLQVSYLGYSTKKILLQDYSIEKNFILNIKLTEEKLHIDEIILKVKKTKYTTNKKIGIDKQLFKFGVSVPFGFEQCVLMKNKGFREGKINAITLFFKKEENNIYEVLPTFFRIKFYEYDVRNKQPGKLLSYEQIILQPENKTQKLNINLDELYIKYPRNGICIGVETFNPGKKKNSKRMYLTSPNLRFTYAEEPLTWQSYKGKVWLKNERKLKSKVFGKVKYKYSNPLIQLDVQFKK